MHAATPAPDGKPPAPLWVVLLSGGAYVAAWVAIGLGLAMGIRYALGGA
jgi:hypothetical protein